MKQNKFVLFILLIILFISFQKILSGTTQADDSDSISRSIGKLNYYLRKLSNEDWPLPGYSEAVKLNESKESVLRLKKYLKATGDLKNVRRKYLASPVFDKSLETAVEIFQQRHGLTVDGIAGENTLQAMNVPLSERVSQIKANIERLKKQPPDMGDRYIIVNIPGFDLEYYDDNRLVTKMKVIVGELENYTPSFHDTMSYIVFNPEWTVPVSISMKEIVPEVISDPGYLAKHNYVILNGWKDNADTIPPEKVDWNKLSEDNFPIRIVQLPGKSNALGKIKFMFPNNYNIYLHDTPAGQLFNYNIRDFSHGCIRIEKPLELAEILLKGQMKPEEVKELYRKDETTSVPVNNKVVVHIIYQTAWVDSKGRLNFRNDIYGLD
jgi:murein L,D-transpeptidase YcbB/YkuD